MSRNQEDLWFIVLPDARRKARWELTALRIVRQTDRPRSDCEEAADDAKIRDGTKSRGLIEVGVCNTVTPPDMILLSYDVHRLILLVVFLVPELCKALMEAAMRPGY